MDRKWKKIEKDGYVILDNGTLDFSKVKTFTNEPGVLYSSDALIERNEGYLKSDGVQVIQ